jgi:histidyl-tRNA synthetase
VKSQFKVADREKAAYCVVVGDSELANGTVVLKDLKTTQQESVARADVIRHLLFPLPPGEG